MSDSAISATAAAEVDVALIGAGIMSATLGAFLRTLEPQWSQIVFERLDAPAEESSSPWNNAGTGHSALCELNYAPRAADGTVTLYGHVETTLVQTGQLVMAGDQIATIGNRGNSTGPHLHWGIVDCSSYTSIKIADSKELGTTYVPGTIGVSRNGS
mgnify:CR=1 FL=1